MVIISFVIFFTPDAKFRMRGEKPEFGMINGRPITAAELREAQRELLTLAQLTGRNRSENIGMDEARQRLLIGLATLVSFESWDQMRDCYKLSMEEAEATWIAAIDGMLPVTP